MKSVYFFIIITLFTCLSGQSQEDSLIKNRYHNVFLPPDLGPKKWKPIIGLDARRSFFRGRPVKINGLRLGVQYRGVHRFGIGFYGLDRNVVFTDLPVNQPGATDTSRVVFNAGFGSLFYERVIYKTHKWEFSLPTEFLFGNITGYYEDSTSTFLPLPEVPFSGLAAGLQTKYYILTWLAPRFSIGYRMLFNTTPEVRSSFNRAYYSFGLSIMVGELYQAIKLKLND